MIEFSNVNFNYKKKSVFKGLSMKLGESNIYGILGLNGAGKTTLLRLLSGQLKPASGEIFVNGFTPFGRNPDFLQDLFYLPEELSLPAWKASEYQSIHSAFYPGFNQELFDENCRLLGIDDLLDTRLNRYSFGQKKKFMIAFALSTGVSLLLLDEPTNGLDIPGKDAVRKAIAGGLLQNQIILISTHQVRDLERLMEPVLILNQGEMLFQGIPNQLEGLYQYEVTSDGNDRSDWLYSEEIPGGYAVVKAGEGKPSPDLEFLFKSFVLSDGRFSEYLNKKGGLK